MAEKDVVIVFDGSRVLAVLPASAAAGNLSPYIEEAINANVKTAEDPGFYLSLQLRQFNYFGGLGFCHFYITVQEDENDNEIWSYNGKVCGSVVELTAQILECLKETMY
jgi:hypothetical protein